MRLLFRELSESIYCPFVGVLELELVGVLEIPLRVNLAASARTRPPFPSPRILLLKGPVAFSLPWILMGPTRLALSWVCVCGGTGACVPGLFFKLGLVSCLVFVLTWGPTGTGRVSRPL